MKGQKKTIWNSVPEKMRIDEYLIARRLHLVRSYKAGFHPNPMELKPTPMVSQLTDMRKEDFLTFRKGLHEDSVLLIKVLPKMDYPDLHEGMLLGNLRGDCQVINLTEVAAMADEEKRDEEGILRDLYVLLTNSRLLRIVENVGDLIKFGERVFWKLDADQFTPIHVWHPQMPKGVWGGVKYEFPERWRALTRGFEGTTHAGWEMGPAGGS